MSKKSEPKKPVSKEDHDKEVNKYIRIVRFLSDQIKKG